MEPVQPRADPDYEYRRFVTPSGQTGAYEAERHVPGYDRGEFPCHFDEEYWELTLGYQIEEFGRLDPSRRQGALQRGQGQAHIEPAREVPPDHLPRVCIEDGREEDELGAQPDVGDVSHPDLVEGPNCPLLDQIREGRQAVV